MPELRRGHLAEAEKDFTRMADRLACMLVLASALAAAGMLGISGCGGSAKSSTSSTPPGTYSIPINVTSGGTTAALKLSITVQ
ncbi:MAG: hypothetical protein ABSC76_08445 [Terracidiphilus sp.]|jgi:hypothetical protein